MIAEATQRFGGLVENGLLWSLNSARMANSLATVTEQPEAEQSWRRRIMHLRQHADDLYLRDQSGARVALDDLLARPEQLLNQRGHWRLRARNAAGKSTLLRHLAMCMPADVFLVCPDHGLAFAHSPACNSAAQAEGTLREIVANVRAPVICLDEVDAAFDAENRQVYLALVAELAQRACVIEVSHRDVPSDQRPRGGPA